MNVRFVTMERLFGALIIAVAFFVLGRYIRNDAPNAWGDFLSLVGTLITALSFAGGCYFALMAASAYSHTRDIEKTAKKTEEINDQIRIRLAEASIMIDASSRIGQAFHGYCIEALNLDIELKQWTSDEDGDLPRLIERHQLARQKFLFRVMDNKEEQLKAAREIVALGTAKEWQEILPFLRDYAGQSKDAEFLMKEIYKRE
jgi:hypothetical protein